MGGAYIDIEKMKKYLASEEIGVSYCREERQYALFLYNIFLKAKREQKANKEDAVKDEPAVGNPTAPEKEEQIMAACLGLKEAEKIKIEHVFYEATLMRDYHYYSEKKDFNDALLNFVFRGAEKELTKIVKIWRENDKKTLEEYHMGAEAFVKESRQLVKKLSNNGEKNEARARLDIVKYMMNAKPDLLVIYKKGNGTYAKALECKMESSEGKEKDILGSETIPQCLIQECTMAFCFGKNEKLKVDNMLHFPKRGIWKDTDKEGILKNLGEEDNTYKSAEDIWEHYVKRIFNGILGAKERNDKKTEENNGADVEKRIINQGTQIVKFLDKFEDSKHDEVSILKKDLLELAYK